MNQLFTALSATALLAVGATGQCLDVTSLGAWIGDDDDVLFPTHYPLGFTFTMAGSAGTAAWTHFRVCTNGWLVLTDGLTEVGIPSAFSYGSIAAGSTASLYGPAGSNPRVAPYWGDLNLLASNAAGVYYDNQSNAGVSTTITWVNAVDYQVLGGVTKSFQAEIFANGDIGFRYSVGMDVNTGATKYVGISAGNGTVPVAASDFYPGPATSAIGAMHESFSIGTLDLGGSGLLFVPNGNGFDESVVCDFEVASNTNYGSGCYSERAGAFYQDLADAAIAAAALDGNAMQLSIQGSGYTATWLAGGASAYVAPSMAAVSLPPTDDGSTSIVPSSALAVPGGSVADLTVSHNGIITLGAVANNPFEFVPSGAALAAAPAAAFYSWHDYNDTEPGSGAIKTEEVGGVLYVTWEGVESYPTTTASPSTLQFQLELATGTVTCVWVSIGTDTSSSFGSSHLVGYKGIDTADDPGSISLAASLPDDFLHVPQLPLSMSASPVPISTPTTGTVVIYAIDDIPEAAPSSGVYFGTTILSLTGDIPGTDLGFINAPGCLLHVGTLDVLEVFVGNTTSQTTTLVVPAGVPYGFEVFAQAVALLVPNSLPNGQNMRGLVTSNGVRTFISDM